MTGQEGKTGWSDYRPSKTLWFWSLVAAVVATIAVGFIWGGWVTGSSAERLAAAARIDGRAQLAAAICVERFMSEPDAGVRLAALKDESSWSRDDTISDAGWTTPLGIDAPIDGAADLCADRLAEMDLQAQAEAVGAVEAN